MTEATIVEACRRCERHMTAGEVEPSMNAFVGMLATARASLDQARWRKTAQSLAQRPTDHLLVINNQDLLFLVFQELLLTFSLCQRWKII